MVTDRDTSQHHRQPPAAERNDGHSVCAGPRLEAVNQQDLELVRQQNRSECFRTLTEESANSRHTVPGYADADVFADVLEHSEKLWEQRQTGNLP